MKSGNTFSGDRTAWFLVTPAKQAFNRIRISDHREYVFTAWAPAATEDMAALRAVLDTNGDGKLTSADMGFNGCKVLVTNANGTTTAQTLAQPSISEINLLPDTTKIVLPDGSTITGQSTFVMGGTTRTAANVTLRTEAHGYRTVQTTSADGKSVSIGCDTGSNGVNEMGLGQKTMKRIGGKMNGWGKDVNYGRRNALGKPRSH